MSGAVWAACVNLGIPLQDIRNVSMGKGQSAEEPP